jgi:hypothetical protein
MPPAASRRGRSKSTVFLCQASCEFRGQNLNKILNKNFPSLLGIDCVFSRKVCLMNDDEHSDMDELNLGLKFENERDRSDRPFLDDNASERSAPSVTKRIFFVSAGFSFLVLLGVGGALAWRSYNTNMSRAAAPSLAELSPASTTKPAALPVSAGEIQQQLNIAIDLAGVKRALKQLAANQDQITHTQEQMAQRIAILQAAEQEKLSPPPPPKSVQVPRPKPVQHPAPLSTQASSKPLHISPPQ